MSQVAVPVESVSAVHVSEPFNVKVTGSFGIGAPVLGLVNTAETGVGVAKFPVTGWTASVDGTVAVTGAGAATSIWSSTERPNREPECVSICCSTSPVAISTCQISPEVESPVQNEVPSGSRLMANSEPWQPGREAQGYVWSTLPFGSKRMSAFESATRTSPSGRIWSWKACTGSPVDASKDGKGCTLKLGSCW